MSHFEKGYLQPVPLPPSEDGNKNSDQLNIEQLLLSDLERAFGSYWKNEELGEKRVSYFLTLTTAVITVLVALYKVAIDPDTPVKDVGTIPARTIVLFALFSLLLFGLVTQMRMVRRNCVTDQYKKIMDQIRCIFVEQSRIDYDPYPLVPRSLVSRGGLADMVAVINGVIAAGIAYMMFAPSDPSNSSLCTQAILAALAVGVGTVIGLSGWAKRERSEYKRALDFAYRCKCKSKT